MKILFMGTPEISATCLKTLINDKWEIAAAVTREDKPRGRGNVMTPTEVKSLALENGIEVFTPKNLSEPEFREILEKINPDMIVVVAYGKILPKYVIEYPKYGCINLHVSLLPKYRGAAPMQRAIMEGERETGVTVMYMDEGLDTGDIISSVAFPITEEDDFESIHDKSASIGAKLLSETIGKIISGEATRTKQNDALATYAKKVEKEDAKIDFSLDAELLSARIRGVTPIPGAFAYLNGKIIKIAKVSVSEKCGTPGTVIALDSLGDGGITVGAGKKSIVIKELKPEGKGKMTAGDFIRGRKINLGDIFE